MMRQYELLERVHRYNPNTNETLLNKAYIYAMQKHGEQKRASGDLYFSHPLEVAAILTSLKLDDSTIVLGLLHDVIEDTDATQAEVTELFGADIAVLVEGITKTKNLAVVSRQQIEAENLRKLLLAVSKDLRVLLVKLADRLHNMRTLAVMREDKRLRIAQETMDIYAPLAARIGMQEICDELEDLAFRHLNPEHYRTLHHKLDEIRTKNIGLIDEVQRELKERFKKDSIKASISGREKRAYSIFRKMQRSSLGFEQLSDIYGFRIIVTDLKMCYRVMGIIHTTWSMVPGRFKDYISVPKQNGYRSIHTTVIGPRQQRVELQIRSKKMHDQNERGIATHSLYKQVVAVDKDGRRKLQKFAADAGTYDWLRDTITNLADNAPPEEFLEHTKLELFQDQIFCFTPKGDLVKLPRDATPIDFAYAIHTDVGNTCVGCKINGKMAPLTTKLENGDEVLIAGSKAQVPPPVWETIVVTGRARAAIRRATRNATRQQFADLGRKIIERAFAREKLEYSDETIIGVLKQLRRNSLEDALAALGRGDLISQDVIKTVFPDFKPTAYKMPRARGEGWFGSRRMGFLKFKIPGAKNDLVAKKNLESGVPVHQLRDNLPVQFISPGGPVPGDRIVGIINPGKGVVVYPIDHPELEQFHDQPLRWLDVRWDLDPDNPLRCSTDIKLVMLNEPGTLATIAKVIGDNDGNIDFINMTKKTMDFHEVHIKVEVWNRYHLNKILSELRLKGVVHRAERLFD